MLRLKQLRRALESIQLIDSIYDDCHPVASGEWIDKLESLDEFKLDFEQYLLKELNEEEEYEINSSIN